MPGALLQQSFLLLVEAADLVPVLMALVEEALAAPLQTLALAVLHGRLLARRRHLELSGVLGVRTTIGAVVGQADLVIGNAHDEVVVLVAKELGCRGAFGRSGNGTRRRKGFLNLCSTRGVGITGKGTRGVGITGKGTRGVGISSWSRCLWRPYSSS